MKYRVWQPIHTGFEIEVEAGDEDEAIELVRLGEFDDKGTNEQLVENAQGGGMPEIRE